MIKKDDIKKLKIQIDKADAFIIGAGAGLSTSAGFYYDGERFKKYFSDFENHFGFSDMYSGGFYPFPNIETMWGFWSRAIWINRYMTIPKSTYSELLELVSKKDYFVITTNVDHCFQKSGFNRKKLYYMQGDYGLFQCPVPCHSKTYDNKETVIEMLKSQGLTISDNTELLATSNKISMQIDSELIPKCEVCGKPMSMNLRIDNSFVEDEGWHKAEKNYINFINKHKHNNVLLLELGVGFHTPGVIKYPFWKFAETNKNWIYACINAGQAYAPDSIKYTSICINADINDVLKQLV